MPDWAGLQGADEGVAYGEWGRKSASAVKDSFSAARVPALAPVLHLGRRGRVISSLSRERDLPLSRFHGSGHRTDNKRRPSFFSHAADPNEAQVSISSKLWPVFAAPRSSSTGRFSTFYFPPPHRSWSLSRVSRPWLHSILRCPAPSAGASKPPPLPRPLTGTPVTIAPRCSCWESRWLATVCWTTARLELGLQSMPRCGRSPFRAGLASVRASDPRTPMCTASMLWYRKGRISTCRMCRQGAFCNLRPVLCQIAHVLFRFRR